MIREITDWHDEKQVIRKDFCILAGPNEEASKHNMYVEEHGYLIDHNSTKT